jgi:hypothetical protein
MKKHRQHDLWLHNNSELSNLLGSEILSRKTLHEWPNSCVQRILLKNTRTYIYKYQSGGIVEFLFYKNAVSPILPKAWTLWEDSWYSCMIIEYLETPIFGQPNISESVLFETSVLLTEEIQKIKGNFPVLLDISSYPKWVDMVCETIKTLRKNIHANRTYGTGMQDIDFIEKNVLSSSIQDIYQTQVGLIHGDLNGGNIFYNGEYKIIDWQSCKLAPIVLDQAGFLSRQGIDPSKYISSEATFMLYFIGIWWLIKCQMKIMQERNFDEGITYFINMMKKIENCY